MKISTVLMMEIEDGEEEVLSEEHKPVITVPQYLLDHVLQSMIVSIVVDDEEVDACSSSSVHSSH